jgi:hypothetical protein
MLDIYTSRHTLWSTASLILLRTRSGLSTSLWIRAASCSARSRKQPESAPLSATLINCPGNRNSCWRSMVRICQGRNR